MSTVSVVNAKHPSSASNNIVLDSNGNAAVAGTATMASSFLRNRIINGGMQIWQRGTSFSGNVYTADRWIAGNNPSSVVQSSDAPAGQSLSLDITGANHLIIQRIESVNAFDLASTPVVVSFWAKSISGTNTLRVQIGTPSAVDNFAVQNVQQTSSAITLSSSWAYYTVSFSALPASASNGVFIFIYRDGSTATDRTRITGVQLEVGSVATPFERRQYGQELALCQRYFVSFGGQSLYEPFGTGVVITSTIASIQLSLPVSLRTTVQTFVAVAPTSFLVNDGVGSPATTSLTYDTGGLDVIMFNAVTGGGLTAGRGARLFSNFSTATRIQIGTEL